MTTKQKHFDGENDPPTKKKKQAETVENNPGRRTFEKKSKALKISKGVIQKFSKHQHSKNNTKQAEKPEDWNEFKKKKKELRLQRRQNKTGFDVISKAKKIGEKLRCRNLKGGEIERNKLINELHSLLKGKSLYEKFVLAHDTSRIVQWLLKYSSEIVKNQISLELIPATMSMLQSKYGIFCAKRLLKYGNSQIRADIINNMYGNSVKLASHALSASVFEYAYTTWATPMQKRHLLQEFFSDIYKNSKDNEIKGLQDVFKQTPELKTATLNAVKTNLSRIMNKSLLDSGLVQSVLNQYLGECSVEDRTELISQLIPHIVVISNSKDGARAAMQCIWHGTNKDRKLAMKTIKEHVTELAKHEHGHCTVIALLDAADDTVLLHKIILTKILEAARDLAVNEWGRKVLMWLVAPGDSSCFHPMFVKELDEGRQSSSLKKDCEIRRKEVLGYCIKSFLDLITDKPEFWLQNYSLAYVMLAIIRAIPENGEDFRKVVEAVVKVIVDAEWTIKVGEKEISGIEDTGLHMILKKLAKHDQHLEDKTFCFGLCVVESISDDTLSKWLTVNRGCFFLVTILENSTDVHSRLKERLKVHKKLLNSQESPGSKILRENVKNGSNQNK